MDPNSIKCKFFSIQNFISCSFLEEKYSELLEDKVALIAAVYRKLTAKDVRLEFREEPTYYQIKKKF